MKKVLVFGMTENPGGIESFIINYYRRLNNNRIQFDFLCNSFEKIAYEDELKQNGSKTIHFVSRSKNPFLFYKQLNAFFKSHSSEYDAIWVNVCSLANIDYLRMAKKFGITRRIIHSHNSQNMEGKLRGILHIINKRVIARYATDFWACSKSAADWFYDRIIPAERIEIIPNAIDLDKNKFSTKGRNEIRKKLGWNSNLIIGNVGRLHFQKNQQFIIKVFYELLKKREDARLILVGQGEDEKKLKRMVKELELNDKVFFAGIQDNVNQWLSAFDVFLFPSLFEGLSIAALEAQANGLPMLVGKECIDKDTKILNTFEEIDLNDNLNIWVSKIIEKSGEGRTSHDEVVQLFRDKGMDISVQASRVEAALCTPTINKYRSLSQEEVKKIELNMLTVFDEFCKNNNLKYSLVGGTLLGAIRHKGFIPWDDDIDVGMPREDYDRLLYDKKINYDCVPKYVRVGRWTDGSNNYPFMRLIDTRTKIRVPFLDPKKCVRNIWIDIFPFDGNPKDKNKLIPTIKKLTVMRRILDIKLAKLGDGKNRFKKIIKIIIRGVLAPISIKHICKYMDDISKRYDFYNSETISGVAWGLYGLGECINREGFMKTIDVSFEGKQFKAMSNYDEYLRGLFHDYMQLPPEEKRVHHSFKAYIKAIK